MAKQDDGGARRLFDKLGAAGAAKYVFTGMMKPAEDDQSIMVARAGDCSKWVQIPARHIQDVEFVQSVQCGDHTHPVVHIFMKDPDSSEAKAFDSLAMLHQGPSRTAMAPHPATAAPYAMQLAHTMALGSPTNIPPGATPCYWDWTQRRWVCP
jgi:hypothetical protein